MGVRFHVLLLIPHNYELPWEIGWVVIRGWRWGPFRDPVVYTEGVQCMQPVHWLTCHEPLIFTDKWAQPFQENLHTFHWFWSLCFTLLQGNGLRVDKASEADTGIYACYMDNFVQPVVSYKFTLMVEGKWYSFYIDNALQEFHLIHFLLSIQGKLQEVWYPKLL